MKRSLGWLAFAILVTSLAGGFFADGFVRGRQSADVRASWLMKSGKFEEAEALYWRELQRGKITVPLVVSFLDAHRALGLPIPKLKQDGELDTFTVEKVVAQNIREHEIDALLHQKDLPPDVARLGRYWLNANEGNTDAELKLEVERAADADPPMPWANHLLARSAWRAEKEEEATRRYEREGAFFERREDIDAALSVHEQNGDWSSIGERFKDPRIDRLASAWIHFRYAVQVHDWKMAFRWSWSATYSLRFAPGPMVLAFISALAWFAFCGRLGRLGERPLLRLPLYMGAFALGLVSVYFTDVLIALQESTLHLEHTGETVHDLLYFLFGVGFREELSKLIMFVPLVPLLLRGVRGEWLSKLDVVVCGALVGLGFAAVENLLYFERDDLGSAMARFLTANFLHMAMTSLTATALFEACREPDKYTFDFSRTLLTVMAMHGAYDYFLTAKGGLAYFAMGVFILLAKQFMAAVHDARKRVGRGLPILHVFILGMSVVVGVSFVYASALVGPASAAAVLFSGLIGLFIVVYFFVQELRDA